MKLLNEIRELFASTPHNSGRIIRSLGSEYPAIVVRNEAGYGVAVEYDEAKDIFESFANSKLYTRELNFEDKQCKYLILTCELENSRSEFAYICTQFVEAGSDGEKRRNLLKDPLIWWTKWQELIGNSISKKEVYSILSEMIVLDEIYMKDSTVKWHALEAGSHDLESKLCSYEVKSTVKRYESTITISGQHQLYSTKRLQLYFCRLEKSLSGVSINDMRDKLIVHGYSQDKIDFQLSKLGLEHGSSIRDEKYKILERRKYEVDEEFPRITNTSFKGDKVPKSILQIKYTIDLNGIDYLVW